MSERRTSSYPVPAEGYDRSVLKRIAVAVLLACCILPAHAGATVTIKVGSSKSETQESRERLYPGTFRIEGKTGDYRGPVTLEVDESPFDTSLDGETVNTTDKGEYVFPKVGPTRNARIRVRAGNEFSKVITLYVHPGVKAKNRPVVPYRTRFVFDYIGHPGFAPPANSFFVYLHKTKERKLRRLGDARRMTQIANGRWRFEGIVKLPSGRYRYHLLACTRGLSAAGYGRFWRIDRSCGDKIIPFPNPD